MATKKRANSSADAESAPATPSATCGLVMPISALDGLSAEHWAEVKRIITEAIEDIDEVKFTVKLVSDADEIGVIQKRIVQNIYSSDVVVCDVSGKNPNVMFELGMRLAFDKATVIVKDDKTDYSFDTGIIEHVGYPRDLRFAKIVDFKTILAEKVLQTYRVMQADPDHSIFLKNFGKFQVASLSEQEVPAQTLVLDMLQEIQTELTTIKSRTDAGGLRRRAVGDPTEGVGKLALAMMKYKEKQNLENYAALVANSEVYSAVLEEVDAPRYFPTSRDFRAAIDTLAKTLDATG